MPLDIDNSQLTLTWSGRSLIVEPSDPIDFVHEIAGEVFLEEDDDPVMIGKFAVYYVDVDLAWTYDVPRHYVFDAHASTLAYYKQMYTSRDDLRSTVISTIGGEPMYQNVLILERLEILPVYRGRQFGLAVLRSMIERFGAGAGIVVLNPYPLQFEMNFGEEDLKWKRQLNIDAFSKNEAQATKALRNYYGLLGFKHLPKTPFMVRSLGMRFPSFDMIQRS